VTRKRWPSVIISLIVIIFVLVGCDFIHDGDDVGIVNDTPPDLIEISKTYDGAGGLCITLVRAGDLDSGWDPAEPGVVGIVGMEISVPGEDGRISTGFGTSKPGEDGWALLVGTTTNQACLQLPDGDQGVIALTLYDDDETANSFILTYTINGGNIDLTG